MARRSQSTFLVEIWRGFHAAYRGTHFHRNSNPHSGVIDLMHPFKLCDCNNRQENRRISFNRKPRKTRVEDSV
jgi:hypothetical protein